MSWIRKKQQPKAKPKDEPLYAPLVDDLIEQINQLDQQIDDRGGQRDERIRKSNIVLRDRRDALQRRLIHDYDSIPTYDDKLKRYKLYTGE